MFSAWRRGRRICVIVRCFVAVRFWWHRILSDKYAETFRESISVCGCSYGNDSWRKASEAQLAASNVLNAVGVVGATITISPNPIDESTKRIDVRVSLPIPENSWLAPRFMFGSLEGQCSLLTERAPIVMSRDLPEPPPPPPPPPGPEPDPVPPGPSPDPAPAPDPAPDPAPAPDPGPPPPPPPMI